MLEADLSIGGYDPDRDSSTEGFLLANNTLHTSLIPRSTNFFPAHHYIFRKPVRSALDFRLLLFRAYDNSILTPAQRTVPPTTQFLLLQAIS